jgi:hypothetical protein
MRAAPSLPLSGPKIRPGLGARQRRDERLGHMDRPDDRLASLVRRLGVLAVAGTALAAAGCGHTPAQTAVGPPSPVVQ